MPKSLLYRLFSAGKIPAPLMSQLNAEGPILFDEGVKGPVTYRNFRAPGKSFSWKRQGFVGSIALTKLRLVAVAYSKFLIDVPLSDERIHAMHYSVEDNGALCVAFDAALFHADWSGTIEYRFKTEEARRLVELLQKPYSKRKARFDREREDHPQITRIPQRRDSHYSRLTQRTSFLQLQSAKSV